MGIEDLDEKNLKRIIKMRENRSIIHTNDENILRNRLKMLEYSIHLQKKRCKLFKNRIKNMLEKLKESK